MVRYQTPPEEDLRPAAPPPQPRRVAVQMPIAEPRLVYVLLAAIVLIFVYFMTLSAVQQNQFLTDWAKINDRIRGGEYYRLFSSMFLHLNLMHLVFNGYALYILGRDVESLFGTVRFGIIYLLGGLSGSLASFIFTSAPSVGASGAIFAIFGAEMVYFYRHRKLHGAAGRQHLNQLIILMIINLALGAFSTTTSFQIDNAGHIGGLVGGLVLAWFIGPSYQVKYDPETMTGFRVVDANSLRSWASASLIYTAGLVALMVYAVRA